MIYFDNSAITYPKPKAVFRSAVNAFSRYSFNSGRGGYIQSIKTSEAIYHVREKVADMFSASPDRIVFTKNCTEALNISIKGSVKKGDHIIISSLEHNSVSRVVHKLYLDGMITYDIADYSFNDDETLKNFEHALRDNTPLVICMHSSNVFGVSFPIRRIGELCKKRGIRFIVDGAQGAGVADINMKRDNIDVFCAPGHKCLFSSIGIGFMAVGEDVEMEELMQGGTGSSSLSLDQPDFFPDKFESGTLNNLGIISLGSGIDYIHSVGRENIYTHEMAMTKGIYRALSGMKEVKLYTPMPSMFKAMPIISFNLKDYPSEKVANDLAKHDICVRAGYHCSPLAHKHFGTENTGTVRVSVGCFNTDAECNRLINLVKKL